MAIKRGTRVDPSTSASSMTDLMFQLLLFMLISTTLINPNALKLMLPKSTNQLKEKPYTTVSITKDLNYYVEMEPVSFDQLEQALQAKMEGAEDPTVSLHCDKTVPVDASIRIASGARMGSSAAFSAACAVSAVTETGIHSSSA